MDPQPQLTNSKEIIEYLANRFPNCFTLKGEVKPLKIGIFQDLVARLNDNEENERVSKTKLRVALKIYTMSWRYLYSIKKGVCRVDLDGALGDMITEEHVLHAQQQLKESKAKVKVKVKAKTHEAEHTKSKPKKGITTKKAVTTTSATTTSTQQVAKKPKTVQVGDLVQVAISRKPINVQIIQIEKDHIRVRVPSGMELTVKSESIITN